MAKTKLRQFLDHIESSPGATSLGSIARELDISVGQVENLLEYWVRKGRLKIQQPAGDCGSCASSGSCPFLGESLHAYQSVGDEDCILQGK
jgi:hypothetical protein